MMYFGFEQAQVNIIYISTLILSKSKLCIMYDVYISFNKVSNIGIGIEIGQSFMVLKLAISGAFYWQFKEYRQY